MNNSACCTKMRELINKILIPIADLSVRIWVGLIFWNAGIHKIFNINATVWLFNNEYMVPLISPTFVAYVSVGLDLVFAVLLIIGLFGRLSALVLLTLNILAMIFYKQLGAGAFAWHELLSLLLFISLAHGPGKIALDQFVWHRFCKK